MGGGGFPYKKRGRGGFQGGRDRGDSQGGRGGFHGGRGGYQGGRGGSQQKDTPNVLESLLKLVFEKQSQIIFDPSTGMLNLSNLRSCEDLANVQQSVDFNAKTFCRTLVSVVQQKFGNPRFLNLNGNKIKSPVSLLDSLRELKMHETVGGISLANNEIDDMGCIFALGKFPNLQELVLSGNKVLKQNNFLSTLRKRVPSLLGLDGESIVRQPLSLPWPIRASYDENQRFILEMVESNLLRQLAEKRFESAMQLYSEKAVFSYTIPQRELMNGKVKCDHRDVQIDFSRLKGDIGNYSRTLLDLQKVKNTYCDRIGIAAALKNNLYREAFVVQHQLNPNASVVFLDSPLMKTPTCIVTVHGRMMWQHPKLQNESRILCFDRTLGLTFQGSWSISNDTISLRPNNDDTLFFADTESRLEVVERTTSIPKEVAAEMVKQCTSDYEFGKLLNEVGSPQLLQECCRLASNNFRNAVLIARLANTRQMDPQAALNALAQSNFVMPQ